MKNKINPACSEIRKDAIICFKEQKSEFRFENPDRKEIICVQVDGCAITDGIRCDKMLLDGVTEYYVELKGCNVEHAVEQLRTSIRLLGNDPAKEKRFAFVVSTRCPLASTEIQKLQKKFKKEYNTHLIIKNSPLIFSDKHAEKHSVR